MRILDRYITRQFILPFIYFLLSFVFLCIILDLFGHIDEILHQKVGLNVLIRYYLSFIHFIFVITAPIATLLTTLYILSGLNKYNEITAMKANGISLFRIIIPFLFLGLIVSILTFTVNDKVVPRSSLIFTTIKEEEIEKKATTGKEKVLFNIGFYGTRGHLFHIGTYDVAKATLKDIIILVQDESNIIRQRILAKHAKWEGDKWRFYDIAICKLNDKGKVIGNPINYEERLIDIDERPEDFQRRQQEPMFMSFRQLRNYILKFKGASPQAIRERSVDLHRKASFPFASLIIILIGIPFCLMTKMKGGILRGIGAGLAIGFIYYCLMEVSCGFGKAGILPPSLSAWLANIVFGAIGIFLIRKI